MKNYRLINNISGWSVFAVAAYTYLMTIEPTASLWDCGEFIASGFKLEVGHPPGNPVFMIMARFFTLFCRRKCFKSCVYGKYHVGSCERIYYSFSLLDNHSPGQENFAKGSKSV